MPVQTKGVCTITMADGTTHVFKADEAADFIVDRLICGYDVAITISERKE